MSVIELFSFVVLTASVRCQDTMGVYQPPKYFGFFHDLDRNDDGKISQEEFAYEAHPKQVRNRLEHFKLADENKDDLLDGNEFFDAMRIAPQKVLDGEYLEYFKNADRNGDGEITIDESIRYDLERTPKRNTKVKEQLESFNSVDKNRDAAISPKELRQHIKEFFEAKRDEAKDIKASNAEEYRQRIEEFLEAKRKEAQ